MRKAWTVTTNTLMLLLFFQFSVILKILMMSVFTRDTGTVSVMHIPAKIKNKRQRSLYSAFYTALKLCVCVKKGAEVMLAQRSNPSLQHQSQIHSRTDKLPQRNKICPTLRVEPLIHAGFEGSASEWTCSCRATATYFLLTTRAEECQETTNHF